MYICGRKVSVPTRPDLVLDEYAEGCFYALKDGRRIGHVVGGNRRYLAEIGDRTLGPYSSAQKAAIALDAQ